MARQTVLATGAAGLLGLILLAGVGWRGSATDAQDGKSFLSGLFSRQRTLTLAEGTPITVRTTVTLSTKLNKAGDDFTGTLVAPVVAASRVVAQKGQEVRGVVAASDAGGRVSGRAHLAVKLTGLQTVGNHWAQITTEAISRGAGSTRTRDAEEIGFGGAIGAAVGAIAGGGKGAAIGAAAGGSAGTAAVLATRGAPAVIPSESTLRFRLTTPAKIRMES